MGLLDVFSRQARQLRKLPLLAGIDAARWETLQPHLEFIALEEDELLFSAGERSEKLHIVLDGAVGLFLPIQDRADHHSETGEELLLQQHPRGETIGDFSVLSGGDYPVSCRALKASRVASFPRQGFELLIDIDPELLTHFYQTAAELSRKVLLANAFIELFSPLDDQTLQALLDIVETRHYQVGETLFRQGDDGDGLYAVVSGRLNVERRGNDGERSHLREVISPEAVGELALLSDRKRISTVTASRESTVAYVSKERFRNLLAKHPTMLQPLTRLIMRRHIDHADERGAHSLDRTFVAIALDEQVPMRRFQQQLRRALRDYANPLFIDAEGFDLWYGRSGASQASFTDLFNSTINSWLEDKEDRYDAVIYVVRPEFDPWAHRCLNRADRILLVANGEPTFDASLRSIERRLTTLFAESRNKPRTELVLLHPAETAHPRDTARWLSERQLDALHHVRMDDRDHFARLARRMSGQANGLVYSGGGARGFAHLGVQQAIEELEIPIDFIGGASMGALLGGTMAMGLDTQQTLELARIFGNRKALYDYTLPLAALMKSAKLTQFCRSVYRDTRIEDLWIPYFCVSSNMSTGQIRIHDRGELWRAVRSSISIPGLFSPVPTRSGQLLIDGGILANFPTDIMLRKLGGNATLIGSTVGQNAEMWQYYNYGTELSGWDVMWTRLLPHRARVQIPRIAETLLRTNEIKSFELLDEMKQHVDVLIEPDVRHVSLLDFKSYDMIRELGHVAASEVLAKHPAFAAPKHSTDSATERESPQSDAA